MDKFIDLLSSLKKRIERLETNTAMDRFVLPKYASDPSPGTEAEAYFNTVTKKARGYDGTTWHDLW